MVQHTVLNFVSSSSGLCQIKLMFEICSVLVIWGWHAYIDSSKAFQIDTVTILVLILLKSTYPCTNLHHWLEFSWYLLQYAMRTNALNSYIWVKSRKSLISSQRFPPCPNTIADGIMSHKSKSHTNAGKAHLFCIHIQGIVEHRSNKLKSSSCSYLLM